MGTDPTLDGKLSEYAYLWECIILVLKNFLRKTPGGGTYPS